MGGAWFMLHVLPSSSSAHHRQNPLFHPMNCSNPEPLKDHAIAALTLHTGSNHPLRVSFTFFSMHIYMPISFPQLLHHNTTILSSPSVGYLCSSSPT
ncbi:hypothetical protein ACSQ67_005997 [Phaseolus vulgaris]